VLNKFAAFSSTIVRVRSPLRIDFSFSNRLV
jgi:hypothetical protein